MFFVRWLRGGEEHLGRRGVRVLLEEVVLDLPHVLDAELVGELDLLERVLDQLRARCRRPRAAGAGARRRCRTSLTGLVSLSMILGTELVEAVEDVGAPRVRREHVLELADGLVDAELTAHAERL